MYAASPIIASVRDFFTESSPPSKFFTAAVAIAVLGQSALTATPRSLNYSAIPSTHIDIPYLAIVYATWPENQWGCMFKGGDKLRMCGLLDFNKYGKHTFETKNVPLILI